MNSTTTTEQIHLDLKFFERKVKKVKSRSKKTKSQIATERIIKFLKKNRTKILAGELSIRAQCDKCDCSRHKLVKVANENGLPYKPVEVVKEPCKPPIHWCNKSFARLAVELQAV